MGRGGAQSAEGMAHGVEGKKDHMHAGPQAADNEQGAIILSMGVFEKNNTICRIFA